MAHCSCREGFRKAPDGKMCLALKDQRKLAGNIVNYAAKLSYLGLEVYWWIISLLLLIFNSLYY
jgi:hypothetical protein